VEDEAFYRERDVDVQLGTRVVAVDPGARAVTLHGGSRLRYDKLLLATGARPRRLPGSS
jgi:NADPH-dependent 2,4-dienoyl-CoA reductase/sulfur reductase-like enzyme